MQGKSVITVEFGTARGELKNCHGVVLEDRMEVTSFLFQQK